MKIAGMTRNELARVRYPDRSNLTDFEITIVRMKSRGYCAVDPTADRRDARLTRVQNSDTAGALSGDSSKSETAFEE